MQETLPLYHPDTPEICHDLSQYYDHVEEMDAWVGEMLRELVEKGELENTINIVTSDQRMPFPRAKANLYEDGLNVQLAVRWVEAATAGRVVDDLVNLIDFMPTIF